jgi:hypothetical protein
LLPFHQALFNKFIALFNPVCIEDVCWFYGNYTPSSVIVESSKVAYGGSPTYFLKRET